MKYVVLIWLLGFGGCLVDSEPIVCTMEARPAVTVQVTTTSGAGEESALVVARDGAYADSAEVYEGGRATLAHERRGTYTVTVEKDGYETWRRENVRFDGERVPRGDRGAGRVTGTRR